LLLLIVMNGGWKNGRLEGWKVKTFEPFASLRAGCLRV
jgi:hypothetical protein